MKVFIASDHAGYDMKQYLLEEAGLDMIDLGTIDRSSCDYPIFAHKLCDSILMTKNSCGILICSTGIGVAITANRYCRIRAALCVNEKMAELSRRHNDANVIVFGANIITYAMALSCLRIFLETKFDGGRHA
ncbi:MAG: ribose 5-phosphate isomerase B, partial [Holosporaceae bacterium]|nr:ribose 5-phosphate isomerase B [Holosporaceae bacterium]